MSRTTESNTAPTESSPKQGESSRLSRRKFMALAGSSGITVSLLTSTAISKEG